MTRSLLRRTTPGGFTLIEIVLVIVIITLLAGTSVPFFAGLAAEREAQEPIQELRLLAREARFRAMTEQRPYQILFDPAGFRLTRHFNPYAEPAEIDEYIALNGQAGKAYQAIGGDTAAAIVEEREDAAEANLAAGFAVAPEEDMDWLRRPEEVAVYRYPQGIRAEIRFWGEGQRVPLSGNAYRSWVFQPSGLCNPVRVSFFSGVKEAIVSFNAITAEIETDESR